MTPIEYAQLAATVAQTLVIIGGGITVVVRTSVVNKELREDIKAMQDELKGLAKVMTTQAVQTERLDTQSKRMVMLEQRIEDLRRGRGYVNDRDASGVDREY